jgi:hypothetical protein
VNNGMTDAPSRTQARPVRGVEESAAPAERSQPGATWCEWGACLRRNRGRQGTLERFRTPAGSAGHAYRQAGKED